VIARMERAVVITGKIILANQGEGERVGAHGCQWLLDYRRRNEY